MAGRKLSIALDPQVAAAVAAVRVWELEHGAFTDDELAWADKVLDRVLPHEESEAS